MKKLFILAASMMLGASAFAQEMNSAYFLDNFVYAHQLNPAMQPGTGTKGHMGLLINNVTVGAQTDFGLDNILFPVDDKLVFCFNDQVTPEAFLGALPENLSLRASVNENILSIGSRSKKNVYTNFEINFKNLASVGAPKDLARFAKVGYSASDYDLSGINVYGHSYLEAALNFSIPVSEHFYFGLGIKGILGIASLEGQANAMNLQFNNGEGVLTGSADATLSVPGVVEFTNRITSEKPLPDFNKYARDLEIADLAKGGYGAAVDLGLHWIYGGFEADLAVLNLGGIRWNNTLNGHFDDIVTGTSTDIFSRAVENTDFTNTQGTFGMLPATVNAGMKYHFTKSRRISAGLFGTYQLAPVSYYEARVGLNVTPFNALGIAATAGYSTLGVVYGAVLNLRLPLLNIYAGVDGIPTRVTPQYVPLSNLNTVVKAGLVFTFGNAKL